MVGAGVLLECLDDPRVRTVLAIVRHSTGVRDPKLTEIIHADFFHYDGLAPAFADCDACFFCLGVTAVGKDEATYLRWTYELTLAAARALLDASPRLVFCYVSGQGTDSSERGRAMWARVKGKTENALLRMPFKGAYMLRPGFIQPLRGVRSRTAWYQAFYTLVGPLFPVFRRLRPGSVTTTVNIGRAMIQLAAVGDARHILDPADINRLAGGPRLG
jgi:uncharacterized protein YbjT (DUF2867 family)